MRPQRGSRPMSRTGASAWRAPVSEHPPPDRRGHRRDDVRIEARRGPDGLLEARRGPGDEAVQALLVDDRRDAEPRLLDQVALDRVARPRPPRPAAGWSSPARRVISPMPSAARAAQRGSRRGPIRARSRTPRTNRAGRPSPRGSSARGGRRRAPRPGGPGRGSWSRWSPSALHRPGGEAADELALGDDVEDERRDHARATVNARIRAVSGVYWVEKFVTPSGSVHWSALVEDDERQEERVPARHDREDRDRGEGRPRQRQQDPPEEAERAAAVDRGPRPRARPGCSGRTGAG